MNVLCARCEQMTGSARIAGDELRVSVWFDCYYTEKNLRRVHPDVDNYVSMACLWRNLEVRAPAGERDILHRCSVC